MLIKPGVSLWLSCAVDLIRRSCASVWQCCECVWQYRPISGRFSTAPNTVIWQGEEAELAPVPHWLRTHSLWMTWSWLRRAESLTPCFSGFAPCLNLHICMFAFVPLHQTWSVYSVCVENAGTWISASKCQNSYSNINLFISKTMILWPRTKLKYLEL